MPQALELEWAGGAPLEKGRISIDLESDALRSPSLSLNSRPLTDSPSLGSIFSWAALVAGGWWLVAGGWLAGWRWLPMAGAGAGAGWRWLACWLSSLSLTLTLSSPLFLSLSLLSSLLLFFSLSLPRSLAFSLFSTFIFYLNTWCALAGLQFSTELAENWRPAPEPVLEGSNASACVRTWPFPASDRVYPSLSRTPRVDCPRSPPIPG